MISSALIVLLVFVVIFRVVSVAAMRSVNLALDTEIRHHIASARNAPDTVHLVSPGEWLEAEHREVTIDPVFVEIFDKSGGVKEKSPNLKSNHLHFGMHADMKTPSIRHFRGVHIRQQQAPLYNRGKLAGYVVVAIPVQAQITLLHNLGKVLLIAYPLVLLSLFLMSRWIAARSIRPISEMTRTARIITRENFEKRVALPGIRDELYTLASTFNSLMDRIHSAILREKQFTSDASHELRTPLAVIKGTLEVLIRKPRNSQEYQEKIQFCISEVDRLSNLVDQLLLIARFENHKATMQFTEFALNETILESLQRLSVKIGDGRLAVDFSFDKHYTVVSDGYLMSIVIDNLLSNAIKYSNKGGKLEISLSEDELAVTCRITDHGIGIAADEMAKVYEQFYRSHPADHPEIKGTGLGLSLVKRICEILNIRFSLASEQGKGTMATLVVPKS
jgi:signal transduction histidine kinase